METRADGVFKLQIAQDVIELVFSMSSWQMEKENHLFNYMEFENKE